LPGISSVELGHVITSLQKRAIDAALEQSNVTFTIDVLTSLLHETGHSSRSPQRCIALGSTPPVRELRRGTQVHEQWQGVSGCIERGCQRERDGQ
jgi:hypothetical protein